MRQIEWRTACVARLPWVTASRSFGLLVLGLMFGISGCAQNPVIPESVSASAEHTPRAAAEPAQHIDAAAPLLSLKAIIGLIEQGKDDEARAALRTFLKKEPKNAQALSLQRQLTTAPRDLLDGVPTEKYTIQNGDTLGALAQKYLGSALKFVALARYNQIQRSRDVRVGQVINVPVLHASGGSPAAESAPIVEPSAEVTPVPPEPAAAPSSSAPSSSAPTPVVPATPAPPPASSAAAPHETAKQLQQRGMAAYKKKNWEAAYAALSSAVLAEPGIEPASTTLVTLKSQLVRQYHEQALVDFRQQNLDQAIALWDKALAIDPNYEPALGYRARALELQHRLKQLGQH